MSHTHLCISWLVKVSCCIICGKMALTGCIETAYLNQGLRGSVDVFVCDVRSGLLVAALEKRRYCFCSDCIQCLPGLRIFYGYSGLSWTTDGYYSSSYIYGFYLLFNGVHWDLATLQHCLCSRQPNYIVQGGLMHPTFVLSPQCEYSKQSLWNYL